MQVRSVVMISSVIPVLVELVACCGKDDLRYEEVVDVSVSEAEFQSALDGSGQLSAEGCEALCSEHYTGYDHLVSVSACEETQPDITTTPADTTSSASEAPESGDTGAPPSAERWVACDVILEDVCTGGRDHRCVLGRHEGSGPTPLAAWFGAQAHAEATSVAAFAAMAVELRRFGAPAPLVDRCGDAARDEVSHARMLRRLARIRGGRPAPMALGRVAARSLLEFAVENAVEGCVHETWAALIAHWQARHAESPEVRAAYARIAEDEARHAQLAWDIDAWLRERLPGAAYDEVRAARRAAVEALEAGDAGPELRAGAGLPTAAQASKLRQGLDGALWQQAA
jgi:hypothetical protein